MLRNNNILIIDEMHESISEMLLSIGFHPDYQPNISRQDIKNLADDYIGMIVRSKTPVNKDLIEHLNSLKFVGRAGAGIDNLEMDYLQSKNIEVVNAPEGNRDALGEHVLGMLLSLSNNLMQSDQQIRRGIWDREGNRGFELKGKTIGLLGYGFMGSAVAEKMSGLGCSVIAYDKYKKDFSNDFVREVEMEEVFEKTDIFSLHVPLTGETKNLVDQNYLNRFHKNIVFVNAARGEVTVTKDLLGALQSGKVTHAALDVLENEKLKKLTSEQTSAYDSLFKLQNVLMSPHVGGWTFESYKNINRVLVDKIAKLDL
ncbi:MAG: phosphoglycerate dehydrogenase [Reichenbachiella sp.]